MPENIANNRLELTRQAEFIVTFSDYLYQAYLWSTL